MESSFKNKISLTINELEPGMVIAEKIYSDNIVLVNRGVVITETIISRLRDKFVFDKIEVLQDEKGNIQYIKTVKEKTVEDIEQSFKELTFNVEGLFKNVNADKMKDASDVLQFAKKIQEELNSPRTVIKDIVLNGSGKDPVYRHSVNVAALSAILGKWIGFEDEQLELLTCAAILHDFGKTKIDKKIVDRFSELEPVKSEELRNHPIVGYDIIKNIPNMNYGVAEAVLMHHERLNGSGYPRGILGDKVNPYSRIIAIADTFDEMNSSREYSSPSGPLEALEVIKKESFGRLDFEYSNIFLNHVINFFISEKVLLSNNSVAQIIQIDTNDIDRPLLLDEKGFIDLKKEKDVVVLKLME